MSLKTMVRTSMTLIHWLKRWWCMKSKMSKIVWEMSSIHDIQKPNVVLSLLKVGCRRMGGAVVGGGGRGASTHPRRRRRRGRRGTQEEKEEEHPSEEEEAEHEETEAQLLSSRQHKRRPLSDRRPRYPSSAKTMPLCPPLWCCLCLEKASSCDRTVARMFIWGNTLLPPSNANSN